MYCKRLILAFALLFSPGITGSAVAQQAIEAAPPVTAAATLGARPALWAIKDQDTTIYLFGTIHLLKPEIRWFEGAVRDAFDRAEEVVLEVADKDDAGSQESILLRAMQPDGVTLSAKLDEDARTAYFAALEKHGVPAALFDRVKPWFAAFTLAVLPLQSMGYTPESGADRAIHIAATKAGKRVIGLETADEQIGFFESMPEELQLVMLNQTIAELPELQSTIETMISAWSMGDLEMLAAVMNETVEVSPEIERILLTDRNARWVDWIAARLARPGTVFVAVGAGHLAGSGSLQEMLAMRDIHPVRVDQAD